MSIQRPEGKAEEYSECPAIKGSFVRPSISNSMWFRLLQNVTSHWFNVRLCMNIINKEREKSIRSCRCCSVSMTYATHILRYILIDLIVRNSNLKFQIIILTKNTIFHIYIDDCLLAYEQSITVL